MDADERAQVRAALMDELEWPTSAGAVQGAADTLQMPNVAAAASRLPDDATYLGIDELWEDLDPHLYEIEHNA